MTMLKIKMNFKQVFGIFLLIFSFLNSSDSWPGGAPQSACQTIKPKHLLFRSKPVTQSPFRVVQDKRTYESQDDIIRVKIQSPGEGIIFRGMIVQPFDPETNKIIGQFKPGEGLKLLPMCGSVTHSNGKEKKAVTLYWQPPKNSTSGSVSFKATVVQKFTVYFQGLKSVVDPKVF